MMLQNNKSKLSTPTCDHTNSMDLKANYVCVDTLCDIEKHIFCFQCMLKLHHKHIQNCINFEQGSKILQNAIKILKDILEIETLSADFPNFKLFCLRKLRILNITLKKLNNIYFWNIESWEFAYQIMHLIRQFMRGCQLTQSITQAMENIFLNNEQIYADIAQSQALAFQSQFLYEEAIICCGNRQTALNLKGYCLLMMNRFEEALQVLQVSLNLDPQNEDLLTYVIYLIESWRGKHFNDEIDFSQAPKSTIDTLIGKKFMILDKYAQAIKLFDGCIENNQLNFMALSFKGLCLFKTKKFQESKYCCDKAMQIYPQYYAAIYLKYLLLMNENQVDEAKQIISQKFNPQESQAIFSKQFICFNNENNYPELVKLIQSKMNEKQNLLDLNSNKNQMNNLLQKGIYLLSQSKLDEALTLFEKGIEMDVKNEQFWKYKILTLFIQEKILDVEDSIQTYQSLNPESKEIKNIKNQFLFALYHQNNLEPKKNLNEIIKATQDTQELYLQGYQCLQGRYYAKAFEIYSEIIQFDPTFEEAQLKQIYALIFLKKFEEANLLLMNYLDDAEYSTQAMQMKGIALYEQQQYSEALTMFKLVEERDPNFMFVRLYQGHCYYKLKNFYQAKDIYYELLVLAQTTSVKQSYAIRYFKSVYALKYIDENYMRFLPFKQFAILLLEKDKEVNSNLNYLFILWLFIIGVDQKEKKLQKLGQIFFSYFSNCQIYQIKYAELLNVQGYFQQSCQIYLKLLASNIHYIPALVGLQTIQSKLSTSGELKNIITLIISSFSSQINDNQLHQIFLSEMEEYEGKMLIPELCSLQQEIFHQFVCSF